MNAIDLESESVMTCDWIRIKFSSFSVLNPNACVEDIGRFSRSFTKMSHQVLNKQTVDLMYAIQLETRSRSLQELHPEIWEPLIRANETLDKITARQNDQEFQVTAVKGWQGNYDKHLEPVFTDIAIEYLKQKE